MNWASRHSSRVECARGCHTSFPVHLYSINHVITDNHTKPHNITGDEKRNAGKPQLRIFCRFHIGRNWGKLSSLFFASNGRYPIRGPQQISIAAAVKALRGSPASPYSLRVMYAQGKFPSRPVIGRFKLKRRTLNHKNIHPTECEVTLFFPVRKIDVPDTFKSLFLLRRFFLDRAVSDARISSLRRISSAMHL